MNCLILQQYAYVLQLQFYQQLATVTVSITGCNQVMEMTVISSTPSDLLSETICSVYSGRHKQTVFLIFLLQAVSLQGSLSAMGEDSRPAE